MTEMTPIQPQLLTDYEKALLVIDTLQQRNAALAQALVTSRRMLITFGGDPRKDIAEHGSLDGDEMQATLLDGIDTALAANGGGDV